MVEGIFFTVFMADTCRFIVSGQEYIRDVIIADVGDHFGCMPQVITDMLSRVLWSVATVGSLDFSECHSIVFGRCFEEF